MRNGIIVGCLDPRLDGRRVMVLGEANLDSIGLHIVQEEHAFPYVWIQSRFGKNFVRAERIQYEREG